MCTGIWETHSAATVTFHHVNLHEVIFTIRIMEYFNPIHKEERVKVEEEKGIFGMRLRNLEV